MGNQGTVVNAPVVLPGELLLSKKVATPQPPDCPYTLLLGAGASDSSGILTAEGMVKEWQQQLANEKGAGGHDALAAYYEWKRDNAEPNDSDYACLFKYLYQESAERQLYLERVIDGRLPTLGYLFLAGLIAGGRFNRVLTTNFDDLVNDALRLYYDIRPIVSAFDSAVAGIRVASPRPKILKLHGDFLFDNLRNVGQELRSLDRNMEQKLLETCKNAGLIVVGYGGADDSIMDPIRLMLRDRDSQFLSLGLHWCIYQASPEVPIVVPEKLEDLVRSHGDRVHLYVIRGFDSLMESMFRECNASLPPCLLDPHTDNTAMRLLVAARKNSSCKPSPFSAACLADIAKSLTNLRQSPMVEVAHAETNYQNAKVAKLAGQFDEATRLARIAYELVVTALANEKEPLPLDVRMEAIKRLEGVSLLLATLEHGRTGGSTDGWKAHLQEALAAFETGAEACSRPESEFVDRRVRCDIFYNGCCAFGLLHQYSGHVLEPAQSERLQFAFQEMVRLDHDGFFVGDLRGDSDFETLRDQFWPTDVGVAGKSSAAKGSKTASPVRANKGEKGEKGEVSTTEPAEPNQQN